MTTGERELASFESVGAGAPPLNSSSNYVPSLSGQLSDWTMPAGPVQGLVEGAIDGAAHKTHPREPARPRIKGLLELGHVLPGFGPVVPQLAGPGRRTPGSTKLSV